MKHITCTVLLILALFITLQAQHISFEVSVGDPAAQKYHVKLTYRDIKTEVADFNMCTWTPGFYEIVDFAGAVADFKVTDTTGALVDWKKSGENTWTVYNPHHHALVVSYNVKAANPFIGNINLNEHYGFIIPGALLMYVKEELRNPVTVKILPYSSWPSFIATGMNALPGNPNTFYAADFDELYDSPVLMGELEELPGMTVKGIPHNFVGYNLGDFDRNQLMIDVKKIVTSGSDIIGDIPYNHYSFLAVGFNGGGFGGIEHLNSVAMLVDTKNLLSDSGKRKSFYNFLAHEYFHLYNVKRIRPIELGPFDYSKENYTNLLWLSEGVTDYYASLITKGAGLITEEDVLNDYSEHIRNYENKEGHLYQSATEASRNIWAIRGNPFARTAEELNRTISVYDKGCALGLLLDLKIRHETQNRSSLDSVMRILYKKYYKELKRGFTEKEFQTTCETVAGVQLSELFEYASTTKPVNYPAYFAYAGLAIDTTGKIIEGRYLGVKVDSNMVIEEVEWQSPAWKAGLKAGDQLSDVDGVKQSPASFQVMMSKKKNGDQLQLNVKRDHQSKRFVVRLAPKHEKTFTITRLDKPDALQQQIFKSWMRN
jgi:predicted metalloprotease with PDZ domain